MTSAELDIIGESLFGQHYKRQLAEALGVGLRRVQEWCAGEALIPEGIAADAHRLVRERQERLKNIRPAG